MNFFNYKFINFFFNNIIIFVSFFFLFYIFFKHYIFWQDTRLDYYLIYYILSTLLIIISALSKYLNKILKINAYILIIGIILILIGTESYFSKNFLNKVIKYEKLTGKKYDTRTLYEILADLNHSQKKYYIRIPPKIFVEENYDFIPLSGISNVNTIYCNENGYYSQYLSDQFGFNNPNEEWGKNYFKYILVGDSFIHGACVNRNDDIASILRSKYEEGIINLGYGGNGPLLQLASLMEYIKPNTENILWFYFEANDLDDLNIELQSSTLRSYLTEKNFTQSLKLKQKSIDKLGKEINNQGRFVWIKNVLTNKIKSLFQNQEKISSVRKEFEDILKKTKKISMDNNSKLYFIYLPHYSRYKSNNKFETYEIIKNITKKLNIDFIDIHIEILAKEKNPLELYPFELNGHFNEKGYKKIALKIDEIINK